MKMYKMEMEFKVVVGLKEINEFMKYMGFSGNTGIGGQTITLTQTIPFIPNEEYIKKVENIIKEKYQTEELEILDCKFNGYKSLLEVDID